MTEYSASQVLAFLVDVLDEADNADDNALNVVPVVVDDYASILALLGEVCRFAGHPFTIADSAAAGIRLRRGGPRPDPALVRLIEAVTVDPQATGTPTPLVVTQDDEAVTVRIGTDPEPVNPGDRNQLGILTALLDPALHKRRVAVLTYDETGMADDARDRVWRLLMDELPGSGAALPATLIVVVGNVQVDMARHCRAGTGLRWALHGGGVYWRRRYQSDTTDIARIAAADSPFVLMLGAGASISSGLPSGNQLRDQALALQFPDLADQGADTAAQAKEFFHRCAGDRRLMPGEAGTPVPEFVASLTLERVLREEAHTRTVHQPLPTLLAFDALQQAQLDQPGPAVVELRRLLRQRRRAVLLTVNLDQMIEHGARVLAPDDPDPYAGAPPSEGDPAAVRLFVTDEDFTAFPAYYEQYLREGGPVPLLKLHGTIDRSETVRANLDITLPGLREPVAQALRALVPPEGESVSWTYVGCSMRDPDVTAVIRTREFAERAFERWVAPMTDPNVETFAREVRLPAWRAAGLPETLLERSITQTADTFLRLLSEHLLGGQLRPT